MRKKSNKLKMLRNSVLKVHGKIYFCLPLCLKVFEKDKREKKKVFKNEPDLVRELMSMENSGVLFEYISFGFEGFILFLSGG